MARGRLWALILGAVAAAGCAAGPQVEVPAAPPAQTVRAEGLALTAAADQWRAFPPDLDRYYLAIATTIENDRDAAVSIRLEDFELLDPGGAVRPAVGPREATVALFGTYGRRRSDASAAIRPVATYFSFGARFGYPYYYPSPYYPSPYYDPYWYGPPPGYSYAPPSRRRTYEEATGDLIRYGIQPASLAPKASVTGFLYFPRGEGGATALRLQWRAPGHPTPLVAPVAGD